MRLYVKKTKNKNGEKETLWVDYTIKGKRYRKSLGLDNTKSNYKRARDEIIPYLQVKINSGLHKKNIPTVDEFMIKSFSLQSSNRNVTTMKDYKSKYNKHLKPTFGNLKIDSIKGTDITLWQNNLLKKGYAIKTIKSVRGILSTMFEDAIRDELLSKNPVRYTTPLSTRKIKNSSESEIDSFSIEEIKNLSKNASNEQMKNFYMFLFLTGVRGGEAIGMTWDNVNFDRGIININSQISRGLIGPPKWNSYREIPILNPLMPYLKSQYKLTGQYGNYIFLNEKKQHFWDISKIRENYWKDDLGKANIPYRKIHQTRHTFCSTLISQGEDINQVSKIAGHSSTKMTLEIYSKAIPNNNKNFGKTLDNYFGTK